MGVSYGSSCAIQPRIICSQLRRGRKQERRAHVAGVRLSGSQPQNSETAESGWPPRVGPCLATPTSRPCVHTRPLPGSFKKQSTRDSTVSHPEHILSFLIHTRPQGPRNAARPRGARLTCTARARAPLRPPAPSRPPLGTTCTPNSTSIESSHPSVSTLHDCPSCAERRCSARAGQRPHGSRCSGAAARWSPREAAPLTTASRTRAARARPERAWARRGAGGNTNSRLKDPEQSTR
jgi:hypothetical protein